MQVHFTSIVHKRAISFRPLIRYALDAAAQELAVLVTGPRGLYPFLTAELRVIGMIHSRLEREADPVLNNVLDPSRVTFSIRSLGIIFTSLANALEEAVGRGKIKFVRAWSPELVSANALALVARDSKGVVVTNVELQNMLDFGVPGAGPRFTNAEALLHVGHLAAYAKLANAQLPEDVHGARARLALICLLSWAKAAVTEKPADQSIISSGKPDDAMALRLEHMKRVAANAIGLDVSASTALAKHFISWLEDPFVRANMTGDDVDRHDRITTVYKERLPGDGPYGPLPFLQKSGVYDIDCINLTNVRKAVNEVTPINRVDMITEYFHPLGADVIDQVGFQPEDIVAWLETGWEVVKQAQQADIDMVRTGPASATHVTPIAHSSERRGDAGIAAIGEVSGYPIASQYDSTINWSPAQYSLWALEIPPHCMVTRQQIKEKIKQHPLMPVIVRAPLPLDPLAIKIQVVPFSKVFGETAPFRSPSLDTISTLWRATPTNIRMLLGSLGPDVKRGQWRSYASSLQFVGQLSVNGVVVKPHQEHWYHSIKFDKDCFGEPIVLAEAPRVLLTPFRAIPLSAEMSRVATSLAQIQDGIPMNHMPFLQWLTDAEVKPSSVTIDGWIAVEPVRDIVLVPTTGTDDEFELSGNYDVGPYSATRYNAVLTILEPPAVVAPPTIDIPNPVLARLNMS